MTDTVYAVVSPPSVVFDFDKLKDWIHVDDKIQGYNLYY